MCKFVNVLGYGISKISIFGDRVNGQPSTARIQQVNQTVAHQEAVLQLLESTRLPPQEVSERVERALDRSYWEEMNPSLSVADESIAENVETATIEPQAQAQLALERERLSAERESARVRVDSSRVQLAAAERRALLARESRGFFDKSFRLGEADLPTRLRIEAEAAEAERQAARARIELAAAISAWRQALGLLPQ